MGRDVLAQKCHLVDVTCNSPVMQNVNTMEYETAHINKPGLRAKLSIASKWRFLCKN